MLLWDILGFISLVHCLKPSESTSRWPAGTYGIPKPKSGCPETDDFQWLEGWRSQGSTGGNLSNSRSAEFDLDGAVDRTKVNRSFCVKNWTKHDSVRPSWPNGQYCIFKWRACPRGMNFGFVSWDDEDTLNSNSKGGWLPGGRYNNDITEIRFCCKTDGDKKEPIILPTKLPFFLLAYGSDECQMVKWALSTLEWIYYDTEHVNNNDRRKWPYPYNAGKKHPTIYYCYYRECNTSLNGTSGTFHSPNYPEKYPDGQYCSWKITVGQNQQIHLMFTDFSLQEENNTDALYVYDGENDMGEKLGVFYGGHPPPTSGIYSSSNQIFVIFMSDRNVSLAGFSALYCQSECPKTTTSSTTNEKTNGDKTTAATTSSSSTTNKKITGDLTSTKEGAKRDKREETEEKGVNLVAVVVPVVVLIFLVSLALAGFLYYKRKRGAEKAKETSKVIYASPQMASDNPSYDRSTGGPPLSVGNPCYDRGFTIANSGCSETHEMYTPLNPNTMDRREAYQPDRQFHGAPVYVTLEPSQTMENPMYDSTT